MMRALLKRAALTLLMGFVLTSPIGVFQALAHGVGFRQSKRPSVPLEFFYSTGETMSYLETKVFSPADEKFAYQSGRTDDAGRFAFVPDVPGQWRVVVKDEEGHQCIAKVDVTRQFIDGAGQSAGLGVKEQSAVPHGMELFKRCLLGVSLIFNVAAFVLLARRRKAV